MVAVDDLFFAAASIGELDLGDVGQGRVLQIVVFLALFLQLPGQLLDKQPQTDDLINEVVGLVVLKLLVNLVRIVLDLILVRVARLVLL